jgi:T5SS/PEP-CTERM-associated repeat protein
MLEITSGATVAVIDSDGEIGVGGNSNGSVRVDGAGSAWTITGDSSELYVGGSGSGALEITGGAAANSDVAFVGVYDTSSGSVVVDGAGSTWANGGAITVGQFGAATLEITDGGTVTSQSCVIGVGGSASGAVVVDGTGSKWTNTGELRVGGSGAGTLTIRNGGAVEAAKYTIGAKGKFLGSGITFGDVVNDGTLTVGESIGAITIDGNYEQTVGVLEIEVAGPEPEQSDQLVVTGNATLGGNLEMSFVDGYAPEAGDVLEFLTVGGAFVEQGLSIVLPNLMPGFEYQTGFDEQSGVFSLTAINDAQLVPLAGDFNQNGNVDGADLALWQADFGAGAGGDADDDGDSDGADFLVWQRELGNGAAANDSADAVPEPTTLTLFMLAALRALRLRAGKQPQHLYRRPR